MNAIKSTLLAIGMTLVVSCGGGDGDGGGGGGGGGGGNTPPPPSGLGYTSPVTLTVGTAMQPLTPTVSGSVTGFTVTPALPTGLTLNPATGAISGTPSAVSPATTYSITANNAYGSSMFSLSLRVDAPPASVYTQSNLVSDGTVAAVSTDAHLKNPWGLAALPGGPIWVSNNLDRTSTVYDGTGLVQPVVVAIPAGANGLGAVTGIVASASTTEFAVTNGTTTGFARFIFATESGTISGWAPNVNAANAFNAYDDGVGAANYKGLAIASNGGANFLYAADFRNNKIDVFNGTFAKVVPTGGFTDAQLPAGYAPFNIQAVQLAGSTVLVVAYARQDAQRQGEVAGAGLGVVNTFDVNGTLLRRLIPVGGQLNAPWGVAVAPANFGTLSGALLIGNFGDGRINGFDPTTGAFIHALSNSAGPLVNSGLWGISFGNGGRNQPTTTLYLAAGINGELGGLYARVDLGATAPDIVAPTGVAITAPAAASTVSGTVAVNANATDGVGVARVVFSVRVGTTTTEIATDTAAPYTADWNTGSVANGAATLTATAFDAFGNSTTSPGIAVTVNNVPDTTPPTVSLTAPAAGNVSGMVTVTATAADNVAVSQVRFLAGTTVIGTVTTAPYTVQWNTAGVTGAVNLTAEARDGAGNVTTSAPVAVTVGSTAPSLATLQSTIFGPRCSGCHNGVGGSLPGSMNLSNAAATAAAIINVDSLENPAVKRVAPGNPGNSYLVHKLEGTQTVGDRMPLGGPFLDQATVDLVRAWIQAGAAP